ncbi:contractile injection system protein, VgrG/Pvc8 family [Veronia pacifica]|uniref:Phage protein D n=1 Tax=Veronia pacifica TaxID=1080227 RepID=A0A1C3E6L1_9GAMM|nr:contractile injection system protein, VgrG/Pvc8 family [Veronia pacifica]ODA28876.1 hypothetical protein A8L45_22940 [Veronia pacifica]
MLELTGKHADLMLSRLKSWRLEDGNGIEGDALTLTIDSDDFDGLPPKGERYRVAIDGVERDIFSISQRGFSLNPRDITLVLTVAPFSIKDQSGYRERKSASWDNATLATIVGDTVTPHGFAFFIVPELQKIVIPHVDRTDESTQAFLSRLAKNFDAIAKPVHDTFVFVPKGKTKSATGKPIENITLSLPADNRPDSPNFVNVSGELDGRNEFNGVRAFYLSTADGTRQEVKTGSPPFKLLGRDKNSQAEAEQSCAAELRKIRREGRKLRLEAPVNPAAFAEGLIELDTSFPAMVAGRFSIDKVTISGQGLSPERMTIQATAAEE